MSAAKTCQLMSKPERSVIEGNEVNESEEPLASNDPSTKGKVSFSKNEEKLLLLQNALQLKVECSPGYDDAKQCLIRSIFVKRVKGANSLETLFNFIVITKDEMTGDKPRKLWSKIRGKAADWIKLLPVKVCRSFLPVSGSNTYVHEPTEENYVRMGRWVESLK